MHMVTASITDMVTGPGISSSDTLRTLRRRGLTTYLLLTAYDYTSNLLTTYCLRLTNLLTTAYSQRAHRALEHKGGMYAEVLDAVEDGPEAAPRKVGKL